MNTLHTLVNQLHACCHSQLFATPWTAVHQVSKPMGFSRQECWSGLPFPTPGDLPNTGMEPMSLASLGLAGRFFTTVAPGKLSTSIQFSSAQVAQLSPIRCDLMDCSTPGFPGHHQLPELAQTHVR